MPLTIDNKLVEGFVSNLGNAKKIAILSHTNPDGDAVGSSLACYNWLKDYFFKGKQTPAIDIILPHQPLEETQYLPSSSVIIDAENHLQKCLTAINDADLILGVDFNNASRVQPFDTALSNSNAIKMVVDHHHNTDTQLFSVAITHVDLSSTCELLFWLFSQIGGVESINDNVARCLYHGINTDTGGFSYSNEDPSLYEATAALMHHRLDAADVHNRLFNNYSIRKMQLLGFLISEKLKVFPEVGFAYFSITAQELEAQGCKPYDLEGLVNYTLTMQAIQVGAIVKEAEGKVRISFRSKNDFDVNVFAHKYFGGGGHTKASGATSPYDFATTVNILESNMLKELGS
ncbi:MAG: DHH family phosphoesterase [Bacteroidales bacterium]|nr:DHH family phosphoesterase [Bacteroidales bacterium]